MVVLGRPAVSCPSAYSPTPNWPASDSASRRQDLWIADHSAGEDNPWPRSYAPDALRIARLLQDSGRSRRQRRHPGLHRVVPEAGEVMTIVQLAMTAGLPYTALRTRSWSTRRWRKGSPGFPPLARQLLTQSADTY